MFTICHGEPIPLTRMIIKKLSLGVLISAVAIISAKAQIVATDNFEANNPGAAYNDGIQYGDNGGTAFGALTYLTGTGGGIYGETGGARIDNLQSLGIYSGNGPGDTQALGRTINTPFDRGIYSLDARFNLSNTTGFSGFNIKSGLGSTFGANELMSFGLNPSNGSGVFLITDGTGTHTLAVGTDTELRGPAFNFALSFDTLADTYTLTVTDIGNAQSGTFSGLLTDTNGGAAGAGAVAALGFANFNTGTDQNLIADNLSVVPEASPRIFFAVPALLGVFFLRRRQRA